MWRIQSEKGKVGVVWGVLRERGSFFDENKCPVIEMRGHRTYYLEQTVDALNFDFFFNLNSQ